MNMKHIDERIVKEVSKLAENNLIVNVNKQVNPEYLSWMGGSRMSLHPSINDLSITKEEFHEKGKRVIHEKET
jgi:actin-related protein